MLVLLQLSHNWLLICFQSVTIAANGKTADAKSILTVLTLGATKGTSVTLTADGADEDDALTALSEFLTTNHD